ncbi:CoA ester lyase [Planococcus sp. CPCC 101016]|uniref:HpcH/HpaI aldolase/citrate lyase family protein n=1 Tax=Planococcus sp. CPCC 101016 TaxID=2599617 RepID=UPI0011B4B6C9|nr:CoA ester lyase [Planococcus sp. CPCC 101016]TWT06753.1 CoA ester lyase [Planococcus sp. CPCC 101016]
MSRSYLFVPSTNLSIIKKAVSSSADIVIIDLEDAVALSEKQVAREVLREALTAYKKESKIIVRINDLGTSFWEEDLEVAISNGARGIMVPKAETAQEIQAVANRIRKIREVKDEEFEMIPLIESAKGMQFSYTIASADPLVSALAFGSIDFSLDIDCELTPEGLELLFARSQLVIASKAAGISSPIDAVFPDLTDEEGLEKQALFAKQLGFKGKLVIHPKQLELVHQVFSPTAKEVEAAKEIVEAFEKAEESGVASIKVGGQFVDYPVYKKAKKVLGNRKS